MLKPVMMHWVCDRSAMYKHACVLSANPFSSMHTSSDTQLSSSKSLQKPTFLADRASTLGATCLERMSPVSVGDTAPHLRSLRGTPRLKPHLTTQAQGQAIQLLQGDVEHQCDALLQHHLLQ